jgi:hypothetical protein
MRGAGKAIVLPCCTAWNTVRLLITVLLMFTMFVCRISFSAGIGRYTRSEM